jgi:murein DD-endopeptidase MepM/ murein hydrolase activator NlpD
MTASDARPWAVPVPARLVPTGDGESFRAMPPGATGLPLPPHPGAFGVGRRHHTHEGVDLYVPEGAAVTAVEAGAVVAVLAFTGAHCAPPSPWWEDTWAVMVEGASGVVLYGEIDPAPGLRPGDRVARGDTLGAVTRVLRRDKGRPTCMLHLELYAPGARTCVEWGPGEPRPTGLLDPTPLLLAAAD